MPTFIMLILIENYLINRAFKWALIFLLFHTFSCTPTFPYFFLKMPFYRSFLLLSTLKYHLRDKNTETFPRSLKFYKLSIIIFQGVSQFLS